jgi:hypothetical protein
LQQTTDGTATGLSAKIGGTPHFPTTFDISGIKYLDVTGNGISNDDGRLGGVQIFVDADGDKQYDDGELTTTTASDGTWSIKGIDAALAGKTVYEVLPIGYTQTAGKDGYLLTTANQTNLNFANFDLFDILGTKYKDTNGDGSVVGDSGLGGVTIFVDLNGNDKVDDGEARTTSATDGTWKLAGLDWTQFGGTVKEIVQNGFAQTVGNAGYAVGNTSADQAGLVFANFDKIDLSGTKYNDLNGDGLVFGDRGLGGVQIFIDLNGNKTYDLGENTGPSRDWGDEDRSDMTGRGVAG